jgi:hypothetical protein
MIGDGASGGWHEPVVVGSGVGKQPCLRWLLCLDMHTCLEEGLQWLLCPYMHIYSQEANELTISSQ